MAAPAEKQKWTFHELEYAIQTVFLAMDEAENPEDPAYQEALEAALQDLATAEADKADAIAFVLDDLAARAEAIERTITSLQNRKQSYANKAKRLRVYVLRTMQNYGIVKIKGQSVTLGIAKGKASVLVTDANALPFDLVRTKIEADKPAIKMALDAGREVPGAELVTGEDTLSVRRA